MPKYKQKKNPLNDKEVTIQADKVREKIRDVRMSRRLSADVIAKSMGISRPFYTQLEGGKRRLSIEYLFSIAKALEVKPESLLR